MSAPEIPWQDEPVVAALLTPAAPGRPVVLDSVALLGEAPAVAGDDAGRLEYLVLLGGGAARDVAPHGWGTATAEGVPEVHILAGPWEYRAPEDGTLGVATLAGAECGRMVEHKSEPAWQVRPRGPWRATTCRACVRAVAARRN
ncbi:hypothetical protein ACFC1T_09180 [Kitasatospora sp. NPDC056076]|uniref:hypothetical protein n=1 Tax=Kitasatospora sp. NPDC056076 TaxID=3345703 RepID=UPI0035DDDBBB